MANYDQAFYQGSNQNFNPLNPSVSRDRRYDLSVGRAGPAILVVDSFRRNRDLYENPGRYVFQLPKTYTDVTSVALIQANIPSSGYAVNSSNNKVYFTSKGVGGTSANYTATLTSGTYTAANLAANLEDAMNTAIGYSTGAANTLKFEVNVNTVTTAFYITGPTVMTGGGALVDQVFTMTAGGTSNADILVGIGASSLTSSLSGGLQTVTMPNSYSLSPDRYVVLRIHGMERCDSNNNGAQGGFCILPLDSTDSTFAMAREDDVISNESYTYYYPEPLPKLGKLDITFLRPNGTTYEFNGRDHTLIFEISCLTRKI